jgi:hypothetical protein
MVRRFQNWSVMFLAAGLLLSACQKVADKAEIRTEGTGFEAFNPTQHTVPFPDPNDKANPVVDVMTIKGKFQLRSFRGTIEDAKELTRAYFFRYLNAAATIQEGDPVVRAADFSRYSGSEIARLGVELNLPYNLDGDGTTMKFTDPHYYWNEVASDNTWDLRSFANPSPAGIQLFEMFTAPDLVAPATKPSPLIYNKAKVKQYQAQTEGALSGRAAATTRVVFTKVTAVEEGKPVVKDVPSVAEIKLYYDVKLTRDRRLVLEVNYLPSAP